MGLGKVSRVVEGPDENPHPAASVPPSERKVVDAHTGVMTGHPDREKQTYPTVDDYLAAATYDVEPRLAEMRRVITETLPDAEETISHNMPTYRQHGLVVVQFAGTAEHTSLNFFPTAGAFARFDAELKPYATSKSAIRFSLDEPLPLELIADVTAFRLDEAAEFAARKRSGG